MSDKIGVDLSRLRDLIDKAGVPRQTIADKIGCDVSTITKHYNGDRNITIDYVIKYASYFQVSADYLLGLSAAPTNNPEISGICNYTGLSKNSVEILHFFNEYDLIVPTVNVLIESELSNVFNEIGLEPCEEKTDIYTTKLQELGLITAISDYLRMDFSKLDKNLYLAKSGNIMSLSETDVNYCKYVKVDDLFVIKHFKQSQIVDRVLLDNIVDILKSIKKYRKADNNDGNHTQT
jgi:transcriptional regulator with XRE-family HTH domain